MHIKLQISFRIWQSVVPTAIWQVKVDQNAIKDECISIIYLLTFPPTKVWIVVVQNYSITTFNTRNMDCKNTRILYSQYKATCDVRYEKYWVGEYMRNWETMKIEQYIFPHTNDTLTIQRQLNHYCHQLKRHFPQTVHRIYRNSMHSTNLQRGPSANQKWRVSISPKLTIKKMGIKKCQYLPG